MAECVTLTLTLRAYLQVSKHSPRPRTLKEDRILSSNGFAAFPALLTEAQDQLLSSNILTRRRKRKWGTRKRRRNSCEGP